MSRRPSWRRWRPIRACRRSTSTARCRRRRRVQAGADMMADLSERRPTAALWLALAASALVHVTLIAAFLVLASPRLFDSVTQPVEVDIVPEREIAAVKEAPKLDLPQDKIVEDKTAETTQARDAGAKADPPPQAAVAPQAPPQPAAAPTPFAGSPFDFPTLMPSLDGFGFDTAAETKARLTSEEIAAFQTHLQKCWHPPPSMAGAQKLRASLRIALTPEGTLAREPLLIQASASAQGPRLVETAARALRECQPFSFLPADKYQEWKLLDLSFSPRGLAGG